MQNHLFVFLHFQIQYLTRSPANAVIAERCHILRSILYLTSPMRSSPNSYAQNVVGKSFAELECICVTDRRKTDRMRR